MGYTEVYRYPGGFHGWKEKHPELIVGVEQEQRVLAVGDVFPDCRVAVLDGEQDRKYLGLPMDSKWLSLADLNARFVLIQLYNTLCSDCVRETRLMTAFFKIVEADPVLAGQLKIIGLGVYDSNQGVMRFKRQYDVAYPLFADKQGQIFECLGQAELPLAYLLQAKGDGRWTIQLVRSGYFEPDETFLQTLRRAIERAEELD
jgi:peroxiredoxin